MEKSKKQNDSTLKKVLFGAGSLGVNEEIAKQNSICCFSILKETLEYFIKEKLKEDKHFYEILVKNDVLDRMKYFNNLVVSFFETTRFIIFAPEIFKNTIYFKIKDVFIHDNTICFKFFPIQQTNPNIIFGDVAQINYTYFEIIKTSLVPILNRFVLQSTNNKKKQILNIDILY